MSERMPKESNIKPQETDQGDTHLQLVEKLRKILSEFPDRLPE